MPPVVHAAHHLPTAFIFSIGAVDPAPWSASRGRRPVCTFLRCSSVTAAAGVDHAAAGGQATARLSAGVR